MVEQLIERDHWLLIGPYGYGKSTFAAKMAPEYAVLDFDGRWADQRKNVRGKFHVFTSTDVLEVCEQMRKKRRDLIGKVQTVVVDSGTTVLDTSLAEGRLKVMAGQANANDNNRLKADMMRALRGAVMSYQCSTLWIFHMEDGKMSGQDKVRVTIPKYELERMKPNLNAVLVMVQDPKTGKRGIKIDWCRYNNGAAGGQTVWDLEGMWENVPQRLSVFLRNFTGQEGYNGLAYSRSWLYEFLKSKGKEHETVEAMCARLGLAEEPLWFDRASWGAYVEAGFR